MSASHYTLLDDTEEDSINSPHLSSKRAHHHQTPTLLVQCASFSTVIAAMLTLGAVWMYSAQQALVISPEATSLRRVTPYVNPGKLRDVLLKHGASFPPLVNNAVIAFQLKREDPKRSLFEDTTRQWASPLGEVWPEDRHILATQEYSTILQFRNRDFGMEDCIISVTVPSPTDTFEPSLSFSVGSQLDLWLLENSDELLPHISWGHGPARVRKLASLKFDPDMTATSNSFDCLAGGFSTFELACESHPSNCSLDFWQTRAIKSGVVMIQRQSVVAEE